MHSASGPSPASRYSNVIPLAATRPRPKSAIRRPPRRPTARVAQSPLRSVGRFTRCGGGTRPRTRARGASWLVGWVATVAPTLQRGARHLGVIYGTARRPRRPFVDRSSTLSTRRPAPLLSGGGSAFPVGANRPRGRAVHAPVQDSPREPPRRARRHRDRDRTTVTPWRVAGGAGLGGHRVQSRVPGAAAPPAQLRVPDDRTVPGLVPALRAARQLRARVHGDQARRQRQRRPGLRPAAVRIDLPDHLPLRALRGPQAGPARGPASQ